MTQERGIAVHGLRKSYGRTEALGGVDFQVPQGSVALLVGPNGAGKTTLLKVLMDLLPYDEGTVRVCGLDPAGDGARIRAATGFLPEEIEFPFDRLRVREVLALHARFRPAWDETYAGELSRALELKLERPWKKLSKGESRRVQLACSLAPRPPLLLLDEPTDGLDPLGRETVLGLLAEHLARTGATAIYCTHVLHEAQALADRLIVLGSGRIRLEEEADTLRRTHLRLRFSARDGAPASAPFLIREESGDRPERSWVVRADEAEVRAWAASHTVPIIDLSPVSLGDAALAYLAGAPEKNHA
jgi:ABC-2 type transport system ATP-binding protein